MKMDRILKGMIIVITIALLSDSAMGAEGAD